MKHIFIGICALVSALVGFSSCEEDRVIYNGPDYVMFSDSVITFAIQNETDYHDVYVATTQAVDYDRNFGVEVVSKESNAIEGKNFVVESNSVTIKAGERAAAFRIRGLFNSFADTDSIGITLRLVNKDKLWNIYGDKAKVTFQKVWPFNIDTFTGYCRIRSSYFQSYMLGVEYRLIKTERDPENANNIIMKNFLYDGYDIKVNLSSKKPLEPIVTMDEQMIATTGEAFGGSIWEDDILRMYFSPSYPSYFNVAQHFMVQYMTLYVKGIQEQVGTYMNAIEWISQPEAKRMLQDRSTSNGLPKDDILNQR